MYLYLRTQRAGRKVGHGVGSSDELLALIAMPGNPAKPYYFPLIDRGKRTGKAAPDLLARQNIPGSWSPARSVA